MGDQSGSPEGLDPDVLKRLVTVEVDTHNVGDMTHEASVHGFTFRSDEPPPMGGGDEHPYPLDYFTAAIGM
jgi:hypothetical protein